MQARASLRWPRRTIRRCLKPVRFPEDHESRLVSGQARSRADQGPASTRFAMAVKHFPNAALPSPNRLGNGETSTCSRCAHGRDFALFVSFLSFGTTIFDRQMTYVLSRMTRTVQCRLRSAGRLPRRSVSSMLDTVRVGGLLQLGGSARGGGSAQTGYAYRLRRARRQPRIDRFFCRAAGFDMFLAPPFRVPFCQTRRVRQLQSQQDKVCLASNRLII